MGRNRKGKRKTWQSAEMNNLQYRMYYELLEQMACAIYRWEGLPEEIDQRFLELTLFNRGMSVFFWDEEYDAYVPESVGVHCVWHKRVSSPIEVNGMCSDMEQLLAPPRH